MINRDEALSRVVEAATQRTDCQFFSNVNLTRCMECAGCKLKVAFVELRKAQDEGPECPYKFRAGHDPFYCPVCRKAQDEGPTAEFTTNAASNIEQDKFLEGPTAEQALAWVKKVGANIWWSGCQWHVSEHVPEDGEAGWDYWSNASPLDAIRVAMNGLG